MTYFLRFTVHGPTQTSDAYGLTHRMLLSIGYEQKDIAGGFVSHTLGGFYFNRASLMSLDAEQQRIERVREQLPFQTSYELGAVGETRSSGLTLLTGIDRRGLASGQTFFRGNPC